MTEEKKPRKIILMGRSRVGKTTLLQAMHNEVIEYKKTQEIIVHDDAIDTPGEYLENASLASAIALYSYEADVIGILMAADEPYSLYPPNCTGHVNREVIGIITKSHSDCGTERAHRWLTLTGCKTIFEVDSVTGEGVENIIKYLSEPQRKPQETTKN